jgi:putative flavoprotein involved in K+ transport
LPSLRISRAVCGAADVPWNFIEFFGNSMRRTDAIIIGAGQAGLAMSHCLSQLSIDHVVLERGRVAERWRSATWDSLRLLTPNWMSRLPGWRYDGPEPDGFMHKAALVDYLSAYARSFRAPIEDHTIVASVRPFGAGYRVATSRGEWQARVVVMATGECQQACIPATASRIPPEIVQIAAPAYSNAAALPEGGVLVVGASASGLQIAAEIQASGRQTTLAVGRHTRLPRRYRGHDIMTWMDLAGVLDERAEAVPDIDRARRQPSLQLVGSAQGHSLDLPALRACGVRLIGRFVGADGKHFSFAGDLAETTAHAGLKLARLLTRIDSFIVEHGLTDHAGPPKPPVPALMDASAQTIDTGEAGIRTVIWATGYARSYRWLKVPVLDDQGEIEHTGGLTRAPGLYALGLRFMRRRKSNFIDGVGRDAEELAAHIADFLRLGSRIAA